MGWQGRGGGVCGLTLQVVRVARVFAGLEYASAFPFGLLNLFGGLVSESLALLPCGFSMQERWWFVWC